jgi:acyl dehydratase
LNRPISAGDRVPPFTVALTLQRLVMEAGANRDFAPVHVDAEAARRSGARHAYANTTFIETLFEAALRSWGGLTARIRIIEFVMTDFNCVGDEIGATGVVTAAHREDGELTVKLDIWIDSPRGRTASGSAVVVFPETEAGAVV